MIESALSLKLLDLSSDNFFVVDVDGKILYANKTAEKLMEALHGKLNGALFFQYFDEPEKVVEICRKAISGEAINNIPLKACSQNGGPAQLLVSISQAAEENSDGQNLLVTAREIPPGPSASSKENNDFLDTVLENIPNMIFVKDARELRFLRFNREGEKLLGYSRNDLIGKNDYDFFPKEQADFFVGKDREVIAGKKMLDIPEEPISTKEGVVWLHTRKIPVFDDKGNPRYLVGISENITESKEAGDKIKKLNKSLNNNIRELQEANKNLESFSYSVSHDLRAPLRAISGYARILEEDYDKILDAEGKRLLGNIVQNARRMGMLIDDLLAFSRLGRKEVEKADIDMEALIGQVITEQEKTNHHAEIKKGTLHPVCGDYKLLQQALINLVSNAVKYSSKNEKPLVQINSYIKKEEVVYSISDNGVGFDMKYAEKLFGIFQRLHSAEEFEGTGVGLAIVKRIIEKHGGTIWVDAEEGRGATFYFTLPKAKKI